MLRHYTWVVWAGMTSNVTLDLNLLALLITFNIELNITISTIIIIIDKALTKSI